MILFTNSKKTTFRRCLVAVLISIPLFENIGAEIKGSGEYLYTDQRLNTYIYTEKEKQKRVDYCPIGKYAVVEGDIILATVADAMRAKQSVEKRTDMFPQGIGISGAEFRWPNRTIFYKFSDSLGDSRRAEIMKAIKHWETNTDMRFRLRTDESNYVVFESGLGCQSQVGMRGGRQVVEIGPRCDFGSIVHELGHTVGLWHEQSRADRDNSVTIVYENIQPAARPDFDQHIHDGKDLNAYDYGSIMHYSSNAFAINPKMPTIKAPQAIGQRSGLSKEDIRAVKELYP